MPFLCEFDTTDIRPASKPWPDTGTTMAFPHSLVSRPRLSHGFRMLDINKSATVRAKATIPYFNNTFTECHIATWLNTTLHGGIAHILVLPPADLDFLTGEHARNSDDPSSVRITFERRFVTPPKVVVFFNYIDLEMVHNWRLYVGASDIDMNGFTLNIDTWGDTILYGVQACWIAYPEDRPHIFSASVNTMGPITKPQKNQSKHITFGEVKFREDPTVFVGLNLIDIDHNTNLRVNAHVDGVSKTGLVWHIDTWDDTVLYAAGASIIAFD